MDFSDDEIVPDEIMEEANEASRRLVPEKSQQRYQKEFEMFEAWCTEKKISSMKEEVFMAYFNHLSKKYSPSTIWSKYSMIKLIIKLRKNIDLGRFFKLTALLKKINNGFKPKKSKIFEKAEVEKFLSEAPDKVYLMMKVATIFGIAGACRREELMKLSVDDIEEKEDILIITIPNTKTNIQRKFVVCDPESGKSYIGIYKKYRSLRPENTPHHRFFLAYKAGKCSKQCVGINMFGKMPSNIAGFLGLKDPQLYTGHCFRRSSVTMLANSGSSITNIKRHGGWKSTSVAESYIENSIENKKKIAQNILQKQLSNNSPSATSLLLNASGDTPGNNSTSSTPIATISQQATSSIQCISNDSESISMFTKKATLKERNEIESVMNLQCASNCTFNINIYRS